MPSTFQQSPGHGQGCRIAAPLWGAPTAAPLPSPAPQGAFGSPRGGQSLIPPPQHRLHGADRAQQGAAGAPALPRHTPCAPARGVDVRAPGAGVQPEHSFFGEGVRIPTPPCPPSHSGSSGPTCASLLGSFCTSIKQWRTPPTATSRRPARAHPAQGSLPLPGRGPHPAPRAQAPSFPLWCWWGAWHCCGDASACTQLLVQEHGVGTGWPFPGAGVPRHACHRPTGTWTPSRAHAVVEGLLLQLWLWPRHGCALSGLGALGV